MRFGRILSVFMVIFCINLFASEKDSNFNSSLGRSGELRRLMLNDVSQSTSFTKSLVAASSVTNEKKQALGVAMSALVPGSGEMYAGSWIKGAIFIGVETALWYGYIKYYGRGKDWEDIFHDYADTHWEKERWLSYYNPETDPSTHTLPDTKTQQYYEMIGKYDQFKQGWDDWYAGGPDLTPNRFYYEGLRHSSNEEFKRASYCAMLVLANHVISAFDTGFTIRSKNRTVKGDMNLSMVTGSVSTVPAVNAVVSW